MAAVLGAGVLSAAACTTHEEHLDPTPDVVHPRVVYTLDGKAAELVEKHSEAVGRLSRSGQIALTEAAALSARIDSSEARRETVRRLADALVKGVADDRAATTRLAPRAGNALITAYSVTRDLRHRRAVSRLARAVVSQRMGWSRGAGGVGVRRAGPWANHNLDLELTASAAWFLERAGRTRAWPPAARHALDGFRTVERQQEAVGRWYATARERSPMSLSAWSRTLIAFGSSANGELQGIAQVGAQAIRTEVFDPSGRPQSNRALVRTAGSEGLFEALGALQVAAGEDAAASVYEWVLAHWKQDGMPGVGSVRDPDGEAHFALALERRAHALATRR